LPFPTPRRGLQIIVGQVKDAAAAAEAALTHP